MKFSKLLFGGRELYDGPGIADSVRQNAIFEQAESLSSNDRLLIFDTRLQRTWLLASNRRLYCVLDDVRKEKPGVQWTMLREELVSENEVSVYLQVREQKKGKSEKTGVLAIGSRPRSWLYSKWLFQKGSLEQQVRELIKRRMLE